MMTAAFYCKNSFEKSIELYFMNLEQNILLCPRVFGVTSPNKDGGTLVCFTVLDIKRSLSLPKKRVRNVLIQVYQSHAVSRIACNNMKG